jgi:hypothetical protein
MKSVKIVFLMMATILMVSSMSNAADNPKKFSEGTQIQDMLRPLPSLYETKKEAKVNITFIVNDQHELVVLSTNNQLFDYSIKSLMNYKKIVLSDLTPNTVYTLPVTFR